VEAIVTTRQAALLRLTDANGDQQQLLVQVGHTFPLNNHTWILTEVLKVGDGSDTALKGKAVARVQSAGY
jgi:hypothetical protein